MVNHGKFIPIWDDTHIYIEYIPIYNHCLSINWYRIIGCFFEHNIFIDSHDLPRFQIGKTHGFFPAGNLRKARPTSWVRCIVRCLRQEEPRRAMCGEGLICHGYLDDIYGHFLAILYDLSWFYMII